MPILYDNLNINLYPKIEAGRPIGKGWAHDLTRNRNIATLLGDSYVLSIPVPANEDWIVKHIRMAAGTNFLDMRAQVVRSGSWGATLVPAEGWTPLAGQTYELGDVTPAIPVASWELVAAGGELSTSRNLPTAELLDEVLLARDILTITLNTAAAGGAIAYQMVLALIRFSRGRARG